jgi:HEAT repeat protein
MKTVAERVKKLDSLKKSTSSELRCALNKALKDRSPTVRGVAVEIIGDEELNEMLADVLSMLKDSDSEVRVLAIESIGKLTDGKLYADDIVKLLKDKSELVRISAAEILGEIENTATLDELEAALNDKSSLVRSYAAEAIGSIGQPESVKILQKYLSDEDDERAKVGLYVGLYKLDKKDFLANLINLLGSENYRIRCAVANSLSILNLSSEETLQVINDLRRALDKEETVAARSSIESTLTYLQS